MRTGGRLQGSLLVEPHAADAQHSPTGEAPWPTGAGAELPLTCPPPARGTQNGEACQTGATNRLPAEMESQPRVTNTPRGPGPDHSLFAHSRVQRRIEVVRLALAVPGGNFDLGKQAVSAFTPPQSTLLSCNRPRTTGGDGRGCSPGRAGLLAALPLTVIGPSQGITVSLIHRPCLSLHAVHALPLYTCRPQGAQPQHPKTRPHPLHPESTHNSGLSLPGERGREDSPPPPPCGPPALHPDLPRHRVCRSNGVDAQTHRVLTDRTWQLTWPL